MVAFTVAGRTLLGLANIQDPRPLQRSTTSDIYELNAARTGFDRIHRFDIGKSVFQLEAFTAAGRTFLGVAVYAKWGHTVTHETKSYIFEVTPRTVFTDLVRADVRCSECPSGYTCSSALQTERPAGSACVLGVRRECPAGRYQEFPRQSNCVECAPGRYQDATGGTQCKDAPPVRFRKDCGSSTHDCDPCPMASAQKSGKTAMTAQRTRIPRSKQWRKTFVASSAQAASTWTAVRRAAKRVSQAGSATRVWIAVLPARLARNRQTIAPCEPYCDPGHFVSRASNCSVPSAAFRTPPALTARRAKMVNTRTPRVLPVVSLAAVVTAVRVHCGGAFAGVCTVPTSYIANSTAQACTQVMQVATITRCVGAGCPLGKFQQKRHDVLQHGSAVHSR